MGRSGLLHQFHATRCNLTVNACILSMLTANNSLSFLVSILVDKYYYNYSLILMLMEQKNIFLKKRILILIIASYLNIISVHQCSFLSIYFCFVHIFIINFVCCSLSLFWIGMDCCNASLVFIYYLLFLVLKKEDIFKS